MAKILHHLISSLSVYPIIYRVLYIPGGCLGCLPSTVPFQRIDSVSIVGLENGWRLSRYISEIERSSQTCLHATWVDAGSFRYRNWKHGVMYFHTFNWVHQWD